MTKGGAALAVTYGTIAVAVGLTGPGAYSLDQAFGVRMPKRLVAGATLTTAVLVGLGMTLRPASASAAQQSAPTSATRERGGVTGAA